MAAKAGPEVLCVSVIKNAMAFMERIIVKRPEGGAHYNFIGDFDKGIWVCKFFRVRPLVIQKMKDIIWLGETKINEKFIYWPYLEVEPKNFQILKYYENE